MPIRHPLPRRPRLLLPAAALALALAGPPATAAAVRMLYREGPAHGFVLLSDEAGTPLAHGELTQWLESRVVASRLVFRFDDGSIYDEVVRFIQARQKPRTSSPSARSRSSSRYVSRRKARTASPSADDARDHAGRADRPRMER